MKLHEKVQRLEEELTAYKLSHGLALRRMVILNGRIKAVHKRYPDEHTISVKEVPEWIKHHKRMTSRRHNFGVTKK